MLYLPVSPTRSTAAAGFDYPLFAMNVAEMPPCVPSYLERTETVTAVACLVINVVLALLIVYRTPTELRVYSRVLMTNCVMDVVFTFTVMLFQLVSIATRHLVATLNPI